MRGMNKLPPEKCAQVLSMLCEGSSMRSIARMADVSFNTANKLLVDAGRACAAFHDAKVRGVKTRRVQVDEIWSFTYAKQKNVPRAKAAPAEAGDTWTWTAIDADHKLIVSWLVGGRDGGRAEGLEMLAVAGRVLDADGVFVDADRGRILLFTLHRFRTQPLHEVTWLPELPGK
jgi:hypothetical protein